MELMAFFVYLQYVAESTGLFEETMKTDYTCAACRLRFTMRVFMSGTLSCIVKEVDSASLRPTNRLSISRSGPENSCQKICLTE
jgi:hypothetical protein